VDYAARRTESEWKYRLAVWTLVCVSAFLLIFAIYHNNVDNKNIFYGVLVANVLLIGYIVLLKEISLGIIIYLYSLTFLNYYWRFVLPGRWPDLDIPRLMFTFIWFVILLEALVGGRRLLPRTTPEYAMLALLVAILAVMLTKGHIIIRQFLNGYAVPFAMFVCAKNSFRTKKDVDRFLLWFAVPLSIYFPLNHIFEHYRITQLVFPRYILSPVIAGVEIQWGERALGAFLQPVATGMAMVSVYVLSLYRLSLMRGALPKLLRVFITLITPVAVFFSYTRNVYLAFFASITILFLFSRKQRKIGMFIIFMVVLGVLGNWSNITTEERSAGGLATEHTAMARLVLAEASMKMFMDRPFVGVGFTRFLEYSPAYVRTIRTTLLGYKEAWIGQSVNQHNQFLTILTEIGLIGFIPLVIIYVTIWRYLLKARHIQSGNFDYELVVTVMAIWAGYTLNVMFMEPRFFEFMNVLPYIFAGLIIGGYQRATLKGYQTPGKGERS
jgi:hypothetical protein